MARHLSEQDRLEVKIGRKVTWVGFFVNALLGAAKVIAGILGRSGALVADGVHSFSDFITDLIVIIMIGISRRNPNSNYHYGYGKYETFATMLIALLLILVGLGIFADGVSDIIDAFKGIEPPKPTMLALAMCVISILSKEWLYHYTRRAGEKINSASIIANAWHHRSDAFSSVATLLGIAGAMFLGAKWRILDPIAMIVVAGFIVLVGIQLGMPAVKELLEVSLPQNLVDKITEIIRSTPGVNDFHHLRTRRNGSTLVIDMHLKVNPQLTVEAAHTIATEVEQRIMKAMAPARVFVTTHIEPYQSPKTPLR